MEIKKLLNTKSTSIIKIKRKKPTKQKKTSKTTDKEKSLGFSPNNKNKQFLPKLFKRSSYYTTTNVLIFFQTEI